MEKEFERYLDLSNGLRNGYKSSLLPIQNNWKSIFDEIIEENNIPEILKVIYSRCSGTFYEVENQKLMDFVPGYLLIHIKEYVKNYNELKNILVSKKIDGNFVPILRNYSSDFYALNVKTNEIYLVFHDDEEIYLIHKNPLDFLITLTKNYTNKVYFLDEDGFLDYDADLEYQIAKIYNVGIEYWEEE